MSAFGNLAQSRVRYEDQLWNVSILPTEVSTFGGPDRVVTSDDKNTQKSRPEAKVERIRLA